MRPLKLRPGKLPDGTSPFEPVSLIATWLGTGLIPFAAGTWGSLAALPFAWVIHGYAGEFGLVIAAAVATLAGIWAGGILVARSGRNDPGFIVIDEVAGMFLTLAAAPRTVGAYVLGFVLFRIADVIKPWPASWCDKNVHGGLGVMLDDLAAALYSFAGMWLVFNYLSAEYVLQRLGF